MGIREEYQILTNLVIRKSKVCESRGYTLVTTTGSVYW